MVSFSPGSWTALASSSSIPAVLAPAAQQRQVGGVCSLFAKVRSERPACDPVSGVRWHTADGRVYLEGLHPAITSGFYLWPEHEVGATVTSDLPEPGHAPLRCEDGLLWG